MSPAPEDHSPAVLVRLDAVVRQLGDRAASTPRELVVEPELTEVIATLSAATALFENHPLVHSAAERPSPAQPAGDLHLAAKLLQAALTEATQP